MTGYLAFPEWLSPRIAEGLPLRWYGVMYLAAFAVTYLLFRYEARRTGLSSDRDEIASFFTWTIVGLLLGGRLFHVLVLGDRLAFLRQPWLVVWPFEEGQFTGIQGMSYHGGLLGTVCAVIAWARTRRRPLLQWADTLAVCAPLGYTMGRVGNFINGELVGRATAVRWGVLFPQARRYPVSEPWVSRLAMEAGVEISPFAAMVNLPRHPSQLYEGFLEGLLVWALLWLVFRKPRLFPGALVGLYVAGYGAARFMAEYFRAPDRAVGFVVRLSGAATSELTASGLDLTAGQLLSAAMVLGGAALCVVFRTLAPPAARIDTYTE